jgi:hypothetical protein
LDHGTYLKYGSPDRLFLQGQTVYLTKAQYFARLTIAIPTILIFTAIFVAAGHPWIGLMFLMFFVGALYLSWYTGRRAAGWKR